ncbi:DsbA family protein [Oceaniglobus indicus]|uniref:DsbA family protein n=1 Tax=Oceaniglobus indicus TaxID=2047749 RepID=UPI000C178442|nr:DsbA family protein [Oceaniglobus indicus]
MKKILPVAATVAAVLVAGVAYQSFSGATDSTSVTSFAAQAQDGAAADADLSLVQEMTLGNPDAAVTVIEYASFTCPHCRTFHEGPFQKLKADYIDTDKINFVYREVYFDRPSLWAGMVARCGGPLRYFGISSLIYDQQDEWARGEPAEIAASLRRIGKTAGLSDEQLDACMQDADKAQALVATYEKNAAADNITATPSFVIDGETMKNMSYEEMSKILDEKLGE